VRLSVISYALTMHLAVTLLIMVLMISANAETVYKTVDENGNIIFTDKPSQNAEEIKLQELQTIKNPNPAKSKPRPKVTKQASEASYKTFLVTNPANGSGIRSNNGNVTISLSLEPPLRLGHKIIIAVDGKEVANGSASSVSLQSLERGDHNISANVISANGQNLSSTSSSFSLLRASQ